MSVSRYMDIPGTAVVPGMRLHVRVAGIYFLFSTTLPASMNLHVSVPINAYLVSTLCTTNLMDSVSSLATWMHD